MTRPDSRTIHDLLSDNLHDILSYRKITRTELGGRLATLGFTNLAHAKVLRRILDGQRRVDVDELAALALALEVDIMGLLSPEALKLVGDERMARGHIEIGGASLPAFAYDVSVLEPGEGRVKDRARAVDWETSTDGNIVWHIESDPVDTEWVMKIAARYEHLLPVPIKDVPGLASSELREIGMILYGIQRREEHFNGEG